MKKLVTAGRLALILLLATVVDSAGRALVPSTEEAEDAGIADGQSARAGLAGFDYVRLWSDRDYAEIMLRHTDALMPFAAGDPIAAAGLAGVRASIFAALGRDDESRRAIRSVIVSKVPQPEPFVLAWAAAADLPDPDLMVEVVEAIARDVDAEGRSAALPAMAPSMMWSLIHHHREKKQDEQRYRLIEALVAMGWPGATDATSRDSLRMDLVDRRLETGDRAAAAKLAQTVAAPQAFLPLILMRKYDGLLDSRRATLDHFERLVADHDRQTASALAEAPDDYQRVLDRAQFLRGQGREAEAAALLAPFTTDVQATLAHDEQGMWLINESAYALLALGRNEEALAPMSQLLKMDVASNPDLIGPSINYAEMLRRAGRPRESLQHTEQLAKQESYANPYGKMWIMAAGVCSLSDLGRREEAVARLGMMEGRRDDNAAALMRAMLCLDEIDAAEQLVVERLRSDESEGMVMVLQDYLPGGADSGLDAVLYERLRKLRDRPAVMTALDKVGRRLPLPLSRIYYGGL